MSMSVRERFNHAASFATPPVPPPNMEYEYWEKTIDRWHNEGLPIEIKERVALDRYVGLDAWQRCTPLDMGPIPRFETQVLEEDEVSQTVMDENGAVLKELKKGGSIPHYISFPVNDRNSWKEMRSRLETVTDRYPDNWEEMVTRENNRSDVLVINHIGFFAQLRIWFGVERALTIFYDDPALLEEMIEFWVDFLIRLNHKAVEEISYDLAMIWEDMCYKTGPLISPRHFKQYLVPAYKKLTGFLREHGVETICVDCDGKVDELIPLWLEGGVNSLFPFEVQAGMDILKVREEYPELIIYGGLDKRALAQSKTEIDRELEKLQKMWPKGGYLPMLDHAVPPDVPFENFLYYVEGKKRILTV